MKYKSSYSMRVWFIDGREECFDWVGPQLAATSVPSRPHGINGLNAVRDGVHVFIPHSQVKRSEFKETVIGKPAS